MRIPTRTLTHSLAEKPLNLFDVSAEVAPNFRCVGIFFTLSSNYDLLARRQEHDQRI